ncbi:contractile injection system protein, VgrG/Pvc8 family [Pluralibacter gergoviae]|nr:phage late control D family protein [Pluralibacter gergoviae]
MSNAIIDTINGNINVATSVVRQTLDGLAGTAMPDFVIYLGGEDISTYFKQRLISLSLIDNRSFNADSLNIKLSDTDNTLFFPETSKLIAVYLGWKGSILEYKGSYKIDWINYSGVPDNMEIQACSADLHGNLNAKKDYSWHDTTIEDIVHTIAEKSGLFYNVAPGLKNISVSHIDQSQESDVAFLTRLAIRNGAEFSIKNRTMLFLKVGTGTTTSGKAISPITILRSDCKNYSFKSANRFNYTGVTAQWLDTRTPLQQSKQVILLQKKNLHQNTSTPPKAANNEYLIGKKDNILALKTLYASQEQAERAAKDAWEKCQRETYTCKLTLAKGRADLYPETPVMLKVFGQEIMNQQDWIITKATHNLDSTGFTTTLELEIKVADAIGIVE